MHIQIEELMTDRETNRIAKHVSKFSENVKNREMYVIMYIYKFMHM